MIRTPSSGPTKPLTLSPTIRTASISSPESVSSRIAIFGSSIAICRISARFISPPENPSLRYRLAKESSTPSCAIFSRSSLRNSRIGINSLSSDPFVPLERVALTAIRRKFAKLTPGMAVGYWNARNKPNFALSFASISIISTPLKITSPESISYDGCPINPFASVLFPDPFGPMSACTSPCLTERFNPFIMGVPLTLICRSLIVRSLLISWLLTPCL